MAAAVARLVLARACPRSGPLAFVSTATARITTTNPEPRRSALVPVEEFFPGRSKRWIADTCRAGKIPGAVRIGRTWMVRETDMATLGKLGPELVKTQAPTVDDAADVLRRLGVM